MTGSVEAKRRNKWLFIVIVLAAANASVLILNIVLGEYPVPIVQALRTALGFGGDEYNYVVNILRLPRALVAFLVGCGLALSGVILQAITRNPLASPGVIGLNAGAALAAVAIIVMIPSFPIAWLPFVAFGGSFAAAAVTYSISWRRGVSPIRLLLVGIGVSATAGALITYLLTIGKIHQVTSAVIWMTGSVYGRGWEHFWPLLPWLVVLFPAALLLARQLDVLQLGDHLARGLGSRIELIRGLLLLISVGLAGAAVAMAGTVGFIGLMAPHISRQLVGASNRRLLPVAALMGGLIVMTADLLGRTAFAPYEIPCGIITAIVGAPYMIYLLYRKRR
ncbi:putative siderophore transport system permease protein YfhA [Paenibacillus plantiphilus]|uniref:Siderophore transport system permease protein YfhA n=1 Tax=Paenibacillus plantiphilus TaxID=2905650 RepID=A0ABM9BYS4_9BACL|nr:putative siderophore transport system permease protein YfhA [Paenibacillus plantiphilus]